MDGLDDAGAVATGALAAREIDRTGDRATHHGDEGGACRNCGSTRTGAYCQVCGQATHLHRDMTGFAHDVLHGVFHFDGKFWKTLPLLAFRPGHLTRRYIEGERAKFVTPMAMFLFSVFLMFAIVSNVSPWTGPGDLVNLGEGSAEKVDAARRKIGEAIGESQQRVARLQRQRAEAVTEGLPVARIDRRIADATAEQQALTETAKLLPGEDNASPKIVAAAAGEPRPSKAEAKNWFEEKIEHARDNPKLMFYKMKSAAYKYSWALIPLSLPFIWLMFFWKRRVGMYDHAVFATYSLSFMSLLVVAATLTFATLGAAGQAIGWTVLALVPPIHMYKQLRHGYALRRFGAAWRTFALLIVVTITSTLFFVLLLYLGVAD